jgi:beta-lactamase regulating signal transducer with metallopeptidase domain
MTTFDEKQVSEIVALGWTLLHFCWQSTAIVGIYAVVDRCSARSSASIRYSIALCTLALMPLVFIASFLEQERLISLVHAGTQDFAVSKLGTMHAVLTEQIPLAAPVVGDSELWLALHAKLLLPGMDAIWLAGVVLFAIRAAGGWWGLKLLRRRAQSAIPSSLQASFDRLTNQYRLSSRVVLRVSDEVISPMIFGIWHTVVLMPLSAAMRLEPEHLEAMLMHELAHIRRWDYLCNLLQTLVECLFFFQPAMWWVSRRAREFREVCCDEIAAQCCGNPVIYAEALLQMEEQRANHPQLALAFQGQGTLLNRIRRVLGENAMERRSMSGTQMAAVGIVLVGLYIAPHIAQGKKVEHEHAVSQSQSTPEVRPGPMPAANASMKTVDPIEVAPLPPALVGSQQTATIDPVQDRTQHADQTSSEITDLHVDRQAGDKEYLEQMRDAGYGLDLDHDPGRIVMLRSSGVTPEYAKRMALAGLGKPALDDLLTLKLRNISPEYVASLMGTTLALSGFQDIVRLKDLGISPSYISSFDGSGLGKLTLHDIESMDSRGITSEYIASLKTSGIGPVTLREAINMKDTGLTTEYAKAMTAAGFSGITPRELAALRDQGVTPEYGKWLKANFPDADRQSISEAIVFHIDADFVARARANGFKSASLDKLTRLKSSGLLN